ncbi:Formate dehydrogenase, partial [Operophtera brumata]
VCIELPASAPVITLTDQEPLDCFSAAVGKAFDECLEPLFEPLSEEDRDCFKIIALNGVYGHINFAKNLDNFRRCLDQSLATAVGDVNEKHLQPVFNVHAFVKRDAPATEKTPGLFDNELSKQIQEGWNKFTENWDSIKPTEVPKA